MEAMVQNLMTDSVNLTHIITKISSFAEIFFVFTFPNKGNSLSFFFFYIVTFSWEIQLYIFTFCFFVCMFSVRHRRISKTMYKPGFASQ